MEKAFWHQRWQSNEIGFNQSQPNLLMQRYLPVLNLKPGARVFVPLCGKSIDMLWLAEQGYKVVGVELSEIACEAFFKDNRMVAKIVTSEGFTIFESGNITLFAGDFFQLRKECLGNIDVVYDRAALIALPAELRRRYSASLSSLLGVDTQIFLIVTSYDQCEMEGPPFSVDKQEVRALYKERFDIERLYSQPIREIPAHLLDKGLSNATEQVYHLMKKSSIK